MPENLKRKSDIAVEQNVYSLLPVGLLWFLVCPHTSKMRFTNKNKELLNTKSHKLLQSAECAYSVEFEVVEVMTGLVISQHGRFLYLEWRILRDFSPRNV